MINDTFRHLSRLCCALPETAARALAVGTGLLAEQLWVNERRRLHETLDRIFHRLGKQPPEPINQIVSRVFRHFSLTIMEMLRFPLLNEAYLARQIEFNGEEHLKAALARKKGLILVVPHLGNWEILGAAIAHRGYPLHSFFLAQKEDDFGSLLDYFRRFSRIVLHDRDRGGAGALRALKKGEILGMIADQDGGNQAVYGDFLRHWVSIPAGPANWSLRTGAAIMPLYCLRQGSTFKYQAYFSPPLEEPSGATHEDRVLKRTMSIIRWMEDLTIKFPHQYLWFYDRFKPRHEGHLAHLKASGFRMREHHPVYGINTANSANPHGSAGPKDHTAVHKGLCSPNSESRSLPR